MFFYFQEPVLNAVLWKSIVQLMAAATADITDDLAHVLSRSPAPLSFKQEISERLGEDSAIAVLEKSRSLTAPLSFNSMPESRARLAAIWSRRDEVLGGYTYLSEQLAKLSTAGSAVECPICYDASTIFFMGTCGHSVCVCCRARMSTRCPLCRGSPPGWRAVAEIQAFLRNECDGNGNTKDSHSVHPDTSSKLLTLISILRSNGKHRRTLVVCPRGPSLLKSVASELQRAGVDMGQLWGAANNQERVLRAWERGAFDGLLCDTDVLGVSLPAVSVVVFLSPLRCHLKRVDLRHHHHSLYVSFLTRKEIHRERCVRVSVGADSAPISDCRGSVAFYMAP